MLSSHDKRPRAQPQKVILVIGIILFVMSLLSAKAKKRRALPLAEICRENPQAQGCPTGSSELDKIRRKALGIPEPQ